QTLDAEQHAAIVNLVNDVPRLWRDPRTPHRERKRLARLLIEDVTLLKTDHVTAHVRFKGGATRSLDLPLPVPIGLLRKTDPAIVTEIDQFGSNAANRRPLATQAPTCLAPTLLTNRFQRRRDFGPTDTRSID